MKTKIYIYIFSTIISFNDKHEYRSLSKLYNKLTKLKFLNISCHSHIMKTKLYDTYTITYNNFNKQLFKSILCVITFCYTIKV